MRRAIFKANSILAFALVVGVLAGLAATPARAVSNKWKDALVTIGIGTAAGTVLGLSTLPFYGYPEDHLGNILIGAGTGLVVGLGVAVYFLTTPVSEQEHAAVDKDSREFYSAPAMQPVQPKMPSNMAAPRHSYAFTQKSQWQFALNVVQVAF